MQFNTETQIYGEGYLNLEYFDSKDQNIRKIKTFSVLDMKSARKDGFEIGNIFKISLSDFQEFFRIIISLTKKKFYQDMNTFFLENESTEMYFDFSGKSDKISYFKFRKNFICFSCAEIDADCVKITLL